MLNQLRARLEEPDEQPVSSAPSSPPPRLVTLNGTTPSPPPSLEEPLDSLEVREGGYTQPVEDKRRRRRRRKRPQNEPDSTGSPLVVTVGGGDSEEPLAGMIADSQENITPGLLILGFSG